MINLIAMFMTGFYSKDFILESAYGQFFFTGTVVSSFSGLTTLPGPVVSPTGGRD